MKKLTVSIFTTMLFTLVAFPQETFYTQINDHNFHMPMDILIKQDGNMMFSTQYWIEGQIWNSMIFEIDNFGETVNEGVFSL